MKEINTLPVETDPLRVIAQHYGLSTYAVDEQEQRGKRVARYRKYDIGDHDIKLNEFMRKLLQFDSASEDTMAVNLCPTVIDSKNDRCIVQLVEGIENDKADTTEQPVAEQQTDQPAEKKPTTNKVTEWSQEVATNNDFDVLQDNVHRAAIRDADSYVMVSWDNEKQQVVYDYEPAYDGQSGVMVIYTSNRIKTPYMGLKFWQIDEPNTNGIISTRVNAYFHDKVEKWVIASNGTLTAHIDPKEKTREWVMPDGTAIGLPIIPFRNNPIGNYGTSELADVIPLQNALNRFHYSQIIAAELTAFAIYVSINMGEHSTAIVPGMTIKANGITKDMPFDFKKIEGSDLTSINETINNERRLIAEISRTPSHDLSSGGQQSGEFLKQLEVGLVGKCKRFHNHIGSSWEQVFDMAWKVQQAFGTKKPPQTYKRFVCQWKSPEIRNDAQIVNNAKAMSQFVSEKETLRQVAPVYDYTEEKIDKILEEKREQKAALVQQMGAGVPRFGGDNPPPFGGNGGMNPMANRFGQQVAEMSRV